MAISPTGSPSCTNISEPQSIFRVWPFHDLTPEERASAKVRTSPLSLGHLALLIPCHLPQPADFSKIPISAIFVFHDPRNWSLDIQVILDVIRSRGIIGGPYLDTPPSADQQPLPQHERAHAPRQERSEAAVAGSDPIELVFCNPDLLWKSDFPQPRLGQGAFREAFQAVHQVCFPVLWAIDFV